MSHDSSSEGTQQISSQKFMDTPREGLYQSCLKNYAISNFEFLPFFFFFVLVNMGPYGSKILHGSQWRMIKCARFWKGLPVCRVKWTKVWASRTNINCTQDTLTIKLPM